MPSSEKRKVQRVEPFIVHCLIVDGERRVDGYLMDLSPRGARVSCSGDCPDVGASVVLEVRLGGKVGHSRLSGQVMWARADRSTARMFGVTFQGMSDAEQREVEAVLENFQRRAALL